MPIAIGILVGLFAIQAHGTARVGALFGPIMLFYFITISVLGIDPHRRLARGSSSRRSIR